MMAWKTEGTKLYQQLPKNMFENWKPCEPLREIKENPLMDAANYKPWKNNT